MKRFYRKGQLLEIGLYFFKVFLLVFVNAAICTDFDEPVFQAVELVQSSNDAKGDTRKLTNFDMGNVMLADAAMVGAENIAK